MFCLEILKISEFLSENFQFWEMKFSIYLNRRVFLMFLIGLYFVWRVCVLQVTPKLQYSFIFFILFFFFYLILFFILFIYFFFCKL